MHKKFVVNRTKIEGGCQAYTKAAPQQSWSYLTLTRKLKRSLFCQFLHYSIPSAFGGPSHSTIVVADHVSGIQANSLEFHVQFGPPAMQLGPENPPKRTDIFRGPFLTQAQISDDIHADKFSHIAVHNLLTNSANGKKRGKRRIKVNLPYARH